MQVTNYHPAYITETNLVIPKLKLEVLEDSENELTLRITDAENKRFQLPYKEPFPFTKTKKSSNATNSYK